MDIPFVPLLPRESDSPLCYGSAVARALLSFSKSNVHQSAFRFCLTGKTFVCIDPTIRQKSTILTKRLLEMTRDCVCSKCSYRGSS